MRAFGLLGLVLALAISTAGCRDCTTVGCSDHVIVTVYDPGATGDGEYVFDLEAGSYRWSERCIVSGSASCTSTGTAPPRGFLLPNRPSLGPDGSWTVPIGGAPAEVKLTLTRDGVLRGSATARPTYDTTWPNGPECDDGCKQASIAMVLQ